jgi:hypothetical protein
VRRTANADGGEAGTRREEHLDSRLCDVPKRVAGAVKRGAKKSSKKAKTRKKDRNKTRD